MIEFWLILLVGIYSLYLLASIRSKDIATLVAGRKCKQSEVQLLDQTVHQTKISLSRDQSNQWRVWREYRFEFSADGQLRLHGRIILLGQQVELIDLEPFTTIIN
ncbi:MAG: DUF3301 domain-containing protein [Pseudomonadales bacterium]|nr:DUF3301 domain-containing protein [Pseudomonadales bacterium]